MLLQNEPTYAVVICLAVIGLATGLPLKPSMGYDLCMTAAGALGACHAADHTPISFLSAYKISIYAVWKGALENYNALFPKPQDFNPPVQVRD